MRISTKQNLWGIVDDKPAGTTFWLTRGVHKLGSQDDDAIVPKNGDHFIGAPGAIIDGGHKNQYAFVGHAKNVIIEHLTIRRFGSTGGNLNNGVVNHDSASHWTLRWNTITRNAGAGAMIGSYNLLTHNCLSYNGQYAFNSYSDAGVANVRLLANEIVGNNADNWEKRQPGCGCSGGGKFVMTRRARVVGNYVHANKGVGLWADTNNRFFLFQGNYISWNTDEGLMYETSYNAAIVANTFLRNGLVKGPTGAGFPTGAIYISESGSDPRVSGAYGKQLLITRNVFRDNWSGITAWENADLFSGANGPDGASTLVNPKVATVNTCGDHSLIRTRPYINDCRWKTQNLRVTHNTFVLVPSHLHNCKISTGCGFMGLFSNYGTYPDWSPYHGTIVEKHITLSQHNLWMDNSYSGPWHFMAMEAGHRVSWAAWRSTYKQDAGSKLH